MRPLRPKTSASDALIGLWTIAMATFIVGTLYFASKLLIPVALAVLLTFLLSPLVTRMERRIGRIAAVLVVVVSIFTALGGAAWMLTHQLVDLATKLPEYKGNIVAKMHTFQVPRGGVFTRLSETLEELKQELPGASSAAAPTITENQGPPQSDVTPPAPTPVVPREVVERDKATPIELARLVLAPLLGPLGVAVLVLVLVIFMLLKREDLRSRLIRLIGEGRISATTRAMDDAGHRVSRYLLMQLVVNVSYGIPVAIGLLLIGVPNAILWGAFATVLRFIPYAGPWIAALFPILLSLAVSDSWLTPLLTISLYVVLELLSNNVLEPWLYGKHTGVAPLAVLIAAVFWTWLWGPVGLVLATPLTVCLVVIGHHVPRLSFLSVLLSDEEALTPAEDCYHRLLSPGERDELELVEFYLKANTPTALYDNVFIPVLTAAGTDFRSKLLEPDQLANLEQSMRDIIEDLGMRPPATAQVAADAFAIATEENPAPQPVLSPHCRVYSLPARADRDEMAGAMLVQLLRQQGFGAQNAPAGLAAGELLGLVQKAAVDVVCISVVPPSTIIHARYLCLKLRSLLPNQKIVIGVWGATYGLTETSRRLAESGADAVVTSMADAVEQIAKLAPPLTAEMMSAPIPADEEARLQALAELKLLDTEAEPVFDRITARLARVFEMPIALITLVDRHRQFFKSQTGLPESLARERQTARTASICGHVVAKNEVLVIEDLASDRRFANSPLLREHGIRFYAGVPLLAPKGQPIGSLCLLDMKPRQFTERDKRLLHDYATEVMEEFARRSPAGLAK